MELSSVWRMTLSDLFVNLSAGWFGAAFIVPLASKRSKLKIWLLLVNLLFGIITLLAAVLLRGNL